MRKVLSILLFCMVSMVASANKTYTFQLTDNWDALGTTYGDTTAWTNTYTTHTLTLDGCTLELKMYDKQSATITDCPVTKGGDATFTLSNANANILSAEIQCEQWNTKAQTVTLNSSTDGTEFTATSFKSYDFEPLVGTFEASEGIKAVRWTFNSTKNQVGVKYITVVTDEEDVPAPVFANDFEDGTLGEWTDTVPESPYKGGFSVVTYEAEKALAVANVGENELGGTYALCSTTGATNGVKGNSDNWFTSPVVTIADETKIFSFRLAANCSYSPTKDEEEKMKMDVVVLDGDQQTVVATVSPENYFTWKQFAIDLSAYIGESIQVAFHDYGTAGSGAIKDLKYIDNIKLGAEALSDYTIEEVTPLYGQADYTPTYTIRVTNYGLPKNSFKAAYSLDGTSVEETVESTIAAGQSIEYTFTKAPVFYPGSHTFSANVVAENDAMPANNAITEQTVVANSIVSTLPYAVCNAMDEEGNIVDDAVEAEFAGVTGSSKAKWSYDAVKYNAWIYSLTSASKQGEGYLYTTKSFTLPAGKTILKTIGTATMEDMYYEVYVAKYAAEGMAEYATKVGQSEIMRNVPETGGGIDTTTVELDIPESGTYVLAIRPMSATKNAQMTLIGYSLEEAATPLTATFDPTDGAELASFEKGDKITMTLSDPEKVGYVYWALNDNNPANADEAILRTGMMKNNEDGTWYAKFYSQQKLLAGHTYTITAYCYATEADSHGDTSYANTIAQLTATYTGITATFEYSPVTLVSLTPAEGTLLKTVNDNVITAVFSDVVTLTANKNGGMGGDNAAMECASEDGKTWTITIPESVMTSTSGSLNLNVYVKDADGKVVKGDSGEDENSYFVWSFTTYVGSPEFTVTPTDGSVVESIDKIRVSYSGGINNSWQTSEKIKIYKGDEVVYTVADEDFSYDWDDITWMDITLSTPITESGTYKVVFPVIYFALGEEFDGYMSKEQIVEYTINSVADGINTVAADSDNTPVYNIAGQRVNSTMKGIVIKNGKKYLK